MWKLQEESVKLAEVGPWGLKKCPPGGHTSRVSLVAQRWRIHLWCGRSRFDPWVRKIPWRRKWQPTPVFLPGKSHGQRSVAGYSPWGHKESDTKPKTTTTIIQRNIFIVIFPRVRPGWLLTTLGNYAFIKFIDNFIHLTTICWVSSVSVNKTSRIPCWSRAHLLLFLLSFFAFTTWFPTPV